MSHHNLTPKQWEEIEERVKNKEKLKDICKIYGVSRNSIYVHLKKHKRNFWKSIIYFLTMKNLK